MQFTFIIHFSNVLFQAEINSFTKKYLSDLFYTDISAEFPLMSKIDKLYNHMTENPETKQYAVKVRN